VSDAAERLAQAIRDLITEAVEVAIAHQQPPQVLSMTPRSRAHLRQKQIPGTTRAPKEGWPPPGQRPGDPVDEEIRQEYEKKFGERAPKTWGEGPRLIPVKEARERLGGISPTTFYKLVNDGEIRTVKIGSRTFVPASVIDDFIG
jgi:excisionase family DNA binding protein